MDFDLMRERLVKAREFIGYNRKQFAEELGIPYRTVTNYENGAREPGSDYLTKVADFCGCTTDWLLGLTDNAREKVPANSDSCDPKIEALSLACRVLNSAALDKVIAYAEDLAWNPANKKA